MIKESAGTEYDLRPGAFPKSHFFVCSRPCKGGLLEEIQIWKQNVIECFETVILTWKCGLRVDYYRRNRDFWEAFEPVRNEEFFLWNISKQH